VFAEDNSFLYFTFREYLAYVCSAYGKVVPDVSELIRSFHFEAYTDTLLRELSTGNRKKAFLITTFALKLRLLLLDEPVNGLDFQSTEYLYRQIWGDKEQGTVLFSFHILESIMLTSDRVFVPEDGKIRQKFEHGQIHAEEIRARPNITDKHLRRIESGENYRRFRATQTGGCFDSGGRSKSAKGIGSEEPGTGAKQAAYASVREASGSRERPREFPLRLVDLAVLLCYTFIGNTPINRYLEERQYYEQQDAN